jgi:hypothetical protein
VIVVTVRVETHLCMLIRKYILDMPCVTVMLYGKLYATRRRGRPTTRWLDDVSIDLRKMGINEWGDRARDREVWRRIVMEAKAYPGPLYKRLGGSQGRSGRVRKNLALSGIRSPDRPARSQSLYRLSYPAHCLLVSEQ